MTTRPSNASESGPQRIAAEPDFYIERGLYVFTAAYHLRRGYCCGSGCRHCPYGARPEEPRGDPEIRPRDS